MRRQNQYDYNIKVNQVGRASGRYPPPSELSRRSTTPSRIQERMSNSPLKTPLQNAINKAAKNKESDFQRTSMSRGLGKSNYRTESPMVSMSKRIFYEDQDSQQIKAHPETITFIRKYFESPSQEVQLEKFIQRIMQEYESLWGTQNAQKIFDDFTYKISEIFGSGYVNLKELIRITTEDGMIGLILRIFKEIKNEETAGSSNYVLFSQSPQMANISRSFEERLAENESVVGLKNVVHEFMETMYQTMQNEIYQKFNVEMRRMILKYREAEKLLKKINEKINNYADIFEMENRFKEKQREYKVAIEEHNKQKEKLVLELEKQKENASSEKKEKQRISEEVNKLKETLQKYQNVVLNKAMQTPDPSFIRQQSRIINQPLMQSQTPNIQPFKITIDTTHIVQKQNQPAQSKTYTTFHNTAIPQMTPMAPMTPMTPITTPVLNHRESHDSRVQFKPTSGFTTSRVTTYRPLSPAPLSPYHSRVIRP